MRSYNLGASVPEGAIYKDVVVIGNGPSGIMLSYILAGNWPYYTGRPHPDEMLTARLKGIPAGRSLLEEDLNFLSQGLEGRSNNPMSLLSDMLMHPYADVGLDLPSLLEWRHHPEHQVDHIVLGKGPPGGAWQVMDANILTISLGSWMQLPGVDYRLWEAVDSGSEVLSSRNCRASVRSVARYYSDYVKTRRIGRFFRNKTVVTAVRPMDTALTQCRNSIDPETGVQIHQPEARWQVEGYDSTTHIPFTYVCNRVVLATGANDIPNRLGIPGELDNTDYVIHDLATLEKCLDRLVEEEGIDREGSPCEAQCDPILVVGAGLSAADAVIAARFRSLPIIHVFRSKSPQFNGRQLPEEMYPEYHKVHQMMNDRSASYPHYTAMPEHNLVEICPDKKVRLQGPDGKISVHQVSVITILIGSRQDLSILPSNLNLASDPTRPVDCRSNPVLVDPFSYAAVRAPAGMHVVGPLAGDNFVRFLQGGAIAVASNIHKDKSKRETVL
uniref:FAD/NAD(P)-binding domain-containing protein n=1 Tax=Timema cristinae TaxID=61476 RepID=A0A7R9CTR1_TIMCR|nr:unnamed protein product [Timema cristinae]